MFFISHSPAPLFVCLFCSCVHLFLLSDVTRVTAFEAPKHGNPLRFPTQQEEDAELKRLSNKKSHLLMSKMNVIQRQGHLENAVMKANNDIKKAHKGLANAKQQVENARLKLVQLDRDVRKTDKEVEAVNENRRERERRAAAER